MKSTVSVLALTLLGAAAMAQPSINAYLLGGAGFLVPHRSELRPLVTGHSQTVTAGFSRSTAQAATRKPWHALYGYPEYGFEVYYADLGNARQLGRQLALNAMIQLPVAWLSSERINTHSVWGIGLGYNTVVWDMNTNRKAIALSSPFNVCLTAGYEVDFKFHSYLTPFASLRMTHFSNGALRLPNLGTNNLSAAIGVRYRLGDETILQELEPDAADHPPGRAKFTPFASLSTGAKENLPPGGPTHLIYTASIGVYWNYSAKSDALARVDHWYNLALTPLLASGNQASESPALDRFQQGVAIGHVNRFGKASFEVHMGIYTRTVYRGQGLLYHRFQLNHAIGHRFTASLGLMTHWARAHHPEIGLVFSP
jgi:hypothetical protein